MLICYNKPCIIYKKLLWLNQKIKKFLVSLLTSLVVAIIGCGGTLIATYEQIDNFRKENRENNIFQIATKIDLSRVNLIVKNQNYSKDNLLLSTEKNPASKNRMIYIENSSSSTAYDINICVDYNRMHYPTNSTKKWYYLQSLSPNQRIYIE